MSQLGLFYFIFCKHFSLERASGFMLLCLLYNRGGIFVSDLQETKSILEEVEEGRASLAYLCFNSFSLWRNVKPLRWQSCTYWCFHHCDVVSYFSKALFSKHMYRNTWFFNLFCCIFQRINNNRSRKAGKRKIKAEKFMWRGLVGVFYSTPHQSNANQDSNNETLKVCHLDLISSQQSLDYINHIRDKSKKRINDSWYPSWISCICSLKANIF